MVLICVILGCWLEHMGAAPPDPPQNPVNPLLPPDAAMVLTNVTSVYKNIAVKSPTLDFQSVTVYGTNAFKGSLLIAWKASTSPGVLGYRVSYGSVTGSDTNFYVTRSNVTVVAFYSLFSPTNAYWFYIQATNAAGEASPPSNVIIGSTPP